MCSPSPCGGPCWLLVFGHKAADSLLGEFLKGGTTLHLLWDSGQHFAALNLSFPVCMCVEDSFAQAWPLLVSLLT